MDISQHTSFQIKLNNATYYYPIKIYGFAITK